MQLALDRPLHLVGIRVGQRGSIAHRDARHILPADFPRQLARGRAQVLRAAQRGQKKQDREEHAFSVKTVGQDCILQAGLYPASCACPARPGEGRLKTGPQDTILPHYFSPLSMAARVTGALLRTSLAKTNLPSAG